jgi:glucose-6-phosphate isomerase
MNWELFKRYHLVLDTLGFSIDISRIHFSETFWKDMQPKLESAYEAMRQLESGAIANPDEKRMVGHYWLRAPQLAPNDALKKQIEKTLTAIVSFAQKVHSGAVKGASGSFKNLLCIGIGGSALGPQFVSQALGKSGKSPLKAYFIDNTDPDGIDAILQTLNKELGSTLVIVISKSGSTPEPRNGMLEVAQAYKACGLVFTDHAVAITGVDSQLDRQAVQEGWRGRFPMWDWVGGRTSELAAVGLVPAALQGIDVQELLKGAAAMDLATRNTQTFENPAALLASAWYAATEGTGKKDMVILPYKDRLLLLSRYLQQLVMESLGKEHDLKGNTVHQGIAVYGNKGSTDQHAYIQQLRDGIPNFFATFIEVLKDRDGPSIALDSEGSTAGDYLNGFLLGTREALSEKGRQSITITINEVCPYAVGALIALYERAVGLYAYLVGINAYHQPGVEAGKKAAADVLALKHAIMEFFNKHPQTAFTAEQIAEALKETDRVEWIYKLLCHLAANPQKKVVKNAKHPFHLSEFKRS